LEGSDVLLAVVVEIFLGVIDGHAAVDGSVVLTLISELGVRVLWNSLVRSVLMAKVQRRRPVVAEVLRVFGSCQHLDSYGRRTTERRSKQDVQAQVVQLACSPISPSIVALNAFPPTI
jgi:hypothetical protein